MHAATGKPIYRAETSIRHCPEYGEPSPLPSAVRLFLHSEKEAGEKEGPKGGADDPFSQKPVFGKMGLTAPSLWNPSRGENDRTVLFISLPIVFRKKHRLFCLFSGVVPGPKGKTRRAGPCFFRLRKCTPRQEQRCTGQKPLFVTARHTENHSPFGFRYDLGERRSFSQAKIASPRHTRSPEYFARLTMLRHQRKNLTHQKI